MKTFLKIVLVIIIIFTLAAGGGIFYLSRGLETGGELVINEVNLEALTDGTYNGRYNNGRWTNEVAVTIEDHKITKIDLIKDVSFPKPEWTEEIINRVLEQQDTSVDVVSGATVTSKAYLKSIENALKE